MARMQRRSGFTLIELLISIAIITILVALSVPALSAVRRSSEVKETRALMARLTLALEHYSDEFGDYPAGTYFRNPEGFRHAPFSEEGCVLLVKLHQFQSGDDAHVVIDTRATPWSPGHGGLKVMGLHEYGGEHVALVHWPIGEHFQRHTHVGGEEIFVLSGEFIDEHGRYPAGTWIRSPHLSVHEPWVERETVLWVKTGHLG